MSKSVLVGSAYGRRRDQTPVHPIPLNREQRRIVGMVEAKRCIPRQRRELGSFAMSANNDVVEPYLPPPTVDAENLPPTEVINVVLPPEEPTPPQPKDTL